MGALQEINEKLTEIDDKQDRLLQWQAAHTETHKTIVRDITLTKTALFGSDPSKNAGLVGQVSRLQNCKGSILTFKTFWLDVLKLVVVSLILGFIFWQLKTYKHTGPIPKTAVPNISKQDE